MLAQGPWPPAPLGFVLCHPVSSAPSSALLCPGSGSLAVSRVPPFLICMFKMYLQSIFLLRSSLPLRLPAVSLGAGWPWPAALWLSSASCTEGSKPFQPLPLPHSRAGIQVS